MYSGTLLRNQSGNIIGAHQRIDRVAKKHLSKHLKTGAFFPSIKTILYFEGKNGPDGIKAKSPSLDEPWHYINPQAKENDPLIKVINDHLYNLSAALKSKDEVRAGFEAAWLAHAIVDGLTPAHHFPLAETIEELWGKPHSERKSKREKIIVPSTTKREMFFKNWQYWGARGVFNLHWSFEWGIATAITLNSFKNIAITNKDLRKIEEDGYVAYFLSSLKKVHQLGMYEEYTKTGWSVKLGNTTKKQLIPIIMRNVCLAWYSASEVKK